MSYLNETTDFIGDAIGIDPAGCGCTDCLVGNSIPADSYSVQDLLDAAVNAGRLVVNRDYTSFALYRGKDGKGVRIDLDGDKDFTALPAAKGYSYEEGESILILLPSDSSFSEGKFSEGIENVIVKDESEELTDLIDEKLEAGARIVNMTGSPLIYGKTNANYYSRRTYSFYQIPTNDAESIQIHEI